MQIFLCDNCGARIQDGIHKIDRSSEDFCSQTCAEKKVRGGQPSRDEGCPHEDNVDGTTHSTPEGFRRLVCVKCGLDRTEAQTETITV